MLLVCCHYPTTRRSSDFFTIGRRSFKLFGSRSCAGTSCPLEASFWFALVIVLPNHLLVMMLLTCLTTSYFSSFAAYSLITSPVPNSTYILVSLILRSTPSRRIKKRQSNSSRCGMTLILQEKRVIPLSAISSSYNMTSSKNNIGSGRLSSSRGIGFVEGSNPGELVLIVPL